MCELFPSAEVSPFFPNPSNTKADQVCRCATCRSNKKAVPPNELARKLRYCRAPSSRLRARPSHPPRQIEIGNRAFGENLVARAAENFLAARQMQRADYQSRAGNVQDAGIANGCSAELRCLPQLPSPGDYQVDRIFHADLGNRLREIAADRR